MSGPTLQIPPDVINPIIQATITSSIVAALGDSEKVVAQAIATILGTKVDRDGNPSHYTTGKSWLEWAIGNEVKKAATAAIAEYLGERGESIKEQLAKELRRKDSPLARQLAEGLLTAIANKDTLNYRINVEVAV